MKDTYPTLNHLSKKELIYKCVELQAEYDELMDTVKETLGNLDKIKNMSLEELKESRE